jgi:hypothetical protein
MPRHFSVARAGLPDGSFLSQKSKFGDILEGLGMGNVAIFYDHLEYFMAIWNILWPFGIFYGHLEYLMAIWYNLWQYSIVCGHFVYLSQFGMFGPRKIWQPWARDRLVFEGVTQTSSSLFLFQGDL